MSVRCGFQTSVEPSLRVRNALISKSARASRLNPEGVCTYAARHHSFHPFAGPEWCNPLIGGHVMAAETGTGTPAWTAAKAGELKILATLTPGGLAPFGMPDVPTLEKLGADYIVRTFYGFAVRVRTPPDRLEKLRTALNRAAEDPDAQQQMKAIDLTRLGSIPKPTRPRFATSPKMPTSCANT
jgi:Tripartite tricarboxylate transporter family receptor